MKFFTFTLTLIAFATIVHCIKLDEVFSWKELSYSWPSEDAKQDAIKANRYIEKNNLPLGLDIWNDKLFITVPR